MGNDIRGRSCDSSSSEFGESCGDEGDELLVSDKNPIPGVNGVLERGV